MLGRVTEDQEQAALKCQAAWRSIKERMRAGELRAMGASEKDAVSEKEAAPAGSSLES